MSRTLRLAARTLMVIPVLVTGGCPDLNIVIPGFTGVTVELINDTQFDVAPNIRFDDDSGFLAGLFPAEDLSTGLLAPGETLEFTFDCEELGLVFSDNAEQVLLLETFEASDTDILARDDDYECGDIIRFIFIGDGDDFGVVVSVNGFVVD
jgi:hypothetical protein